MGCLGKAQRGNQPNTHSNTGGIYWTSSGKAGQVREKGEGSKEAELPEKAGSEHKASEDYGSCPRHGSDPTPQDLYDKVAREGGNLGKGEN